VPVIPHRKGRVRPSRTDGRRLRRYRRRWVVERTHAWLQSYRGLAVRWSVYAFMHVGLIYLGFIHLASQRLQNRLYEGMPPLPQSLRPRRERPDTDPHPKPVSYGFPRYFAAIPDIEHSPCQGQKQ
jgi:hypothetical protein